MVHYEVDLFTAISKSVDCRIDSCYFDRTRLGGRGTVEGVVDDCWGGISETTVLNALSSDEVYEVLAAVDCKAGVFKSHVACSAGWRTWQTLAEVLAEPISIGAFKAGPTGSEKLRIPEETISFPSSGKILKDRNIPYRVIRGLSSIEDKDVIGR